MAEYYNINYENDEIDKLDKMARELNNKKTSLCKSVSDDFYSKEKDWKNNIDNVINSQKFSYLPMNKNHNNNLYNNDTEKSSDTYNTYNTNISDISDFSSRDNKYFSETASVDSFFDDKSIDTYLNNKENKKNVKFNNIVQSIDYDDCSKDDDDIFKHIKKCTNCRNKLKKFLNNTNTSEKNDCKFSKIFEGEIKNKTHSKSEYNTKQIVIFLMVGIFIIIMLDILIRNKTY